MTENNDHVYSRILATGLMGDTGQAMEAVEAAELDGDNIAHTRAHQEQSSSSRAPPLLPLEKRMSPPPVAKKCC